MTDRVADLMAGLLVLIVIMVVVWSIIFKESSFEVVDCSSDTRVVKFTKEDPTRYCTQILMSGAWADYSCSYHENTEICE